MAKQHLIFYRYKSKDHTIYYSSTDKVTNKSKSVRRLSKNSYTLQEQRHNNFELNETCT